MIVYSCLLLWRFISLQKILSFWICFKKYLESMQFLVTLILFPFFIEKNNLEVQESQNVPTRITVIPKVSQIGLRIQHYSLSSINSLLFYTPDYGWSLRYKTSGRFSAFCKLSFTDSSGRKAFMLSIQSSLKMIGLIEDLGTPLEYTRHHWHVFNFIKECSFSWTKMRYSVWAFLLLFCVFCDS